MKKGNITTRSTPCPASFMSRAACIRRVAFTLIELLVVISIIGVLASLAVGISGVASRKSRESRMKTEFTKLVNAIANYKDAVGAYPPDNYDSAAKITYAGTNQLYYELSGTVFQNGRFIVAGQQEGLNPGQIETVFRTKGFANSARDKKDLKFTEEFKASQVRRAPVGGIVMDFLALPINKGPWVIKGTTVNPWLYVSTSPTNNPDSFDLWAEVEIGGKVIRFSNWEKDPVVINR